MKVLQANNISKKYQDDIIIENVDLELNKGETVCLVGGSGVGKTTLFQILSGLVTPDTGEVLLEGKNVTGKPGNIGYMLQKDLLLPHMTIENNLALPLRLQKTKKKEAIRIATEYLDLFQLHGCGKKYPSQLSGGMRQRAALLRTYLLKKEVILLDEPFSALDEITRSELHLWYIDISRQLSLSTVFISHNIDEAIFLSNRVYVMSGKPGKIVDEIIIKEKNKDTEFLLSSSFLNYKRQVLESLHMKK